MEYKVGIKKSVLKNLKKIPKGAQETFLLLQKDLKEKGPVQKEWPNYSKLGGNKYHCHLKYHYAACWKYEKGTIIIEVYYVGSREKAPY